MRVSKDPAQRKQELVDAALELFVENGYDKTSVKDIVSKVGVAQGLFYYYFPSKEDIVKVIAEQYRGKYLDYLYSKGFRQCTDPIDMVQVLLSESFNYLTCENRLVESMHRKSNKYLHDLLTNAMIDALATLVEDVLVLGNKTGAFQARYPRQLSVAFIYGIMASIHDPDTIITQNFEEERGFILYFTSLILGIDEENMKEMLGW